MNDQQLVHEQRSLQNTHYISKQNFLYLKEIMYERHVEEGSALFRENEVADKLFYIIRGQIKGIKTSAEGKSFLLHMFEEGDMLGEIGSFDEVNYSYNGIATQDTLVGVIQQQDLEVLLWQHGDLAVEFLKWMSLMQRVTQSKLRDMMFHGKTGALCSTLIRMAHSYGESQAEGILIKKKFTNAELGEIIGATRESVNRMLADLTKKEVVDQDKGFILIRDIDYLKNICNCEDCPLDVCRM